MFAVGIMDIFLIVGLYAKDFNDLIDNFDFIWLIY